MALQLPTRGRAIGVYWGDSPETLLAGCRTKSLAISGPGIDVTSDDDAGVRTLLDAPSQLDVTISVSGVLETNAENLLTTALSTSARTRAMQFRWPGSTTPGMLYGNFYLESFTIGAEYQGHATFDATFQSAGTVTLQAAN